MGLNGWTLYRHIGESDYGFDSFLSCNVPIDNSTASVTASVVMDRDREGYSRKWNGFDFQSKQLFIEGL